MSKEIETKKLGGVLIEVKQEDRNGVSIGILEGYAATWDLDRGDMFGIRDQFKKGAFVESLLEHIQKRRQIRFKDHHGRTVGGAPMEFVREDDKGLFAAAEVNLEVQQGRELYALAKQGVIVDFSIGFSVDEFEMDGNIRTITKAKIWEFSGVDEPMNTEAQITQVKNETGNMKTCNSEDVKNWTERDIEQALRDGIRLSKNAARIAMSIISKAAIKSAADEIIKEQAQKNLREMVEDLNSLTESIKA